MTDVVAEAVFVWAIAAEKSRIEEEVALVNPCGYQPADHDWPMSADSFFLLES